MTPVRMGMSVDDSDEVVSNDQRGEIRVTVPDGSKINRSTGPALLEVPQMSGLITPDEVYLFAKRGRSGFQLTRRN